MDCKSDGFFLSDVGHRFGGFSLVSGVLRDGSSRYKSEWQLHHWKTYHKVVSANQSLLVGDA